MHKLLPQINYLLNSNDVALIKDSGELVQLKEFTNKLKALKSNYLSLVNAVCDDIVSINNSLCILLENGSFTQNQKKKISENKSKLNESSQETSSPDSSNEKEEEEVI